jgi:hypothetical protein
MAEIKGYIYEEIRNLAYSKKSTALQDVENSYKKELEQVKKDAEKGITPKVIKVAQLKVSISSYGDLKVEAKIPEDKRKTLLDKYEKLTSVVKQKISKEKQAIVQKFEKWLCEFAKNANEGIVIDLPKFD